MPFGSCVKVYLLITWIEGNIHMLKALSLSFTLTQLGENSKGHLLEISPRCNRQFQEWTVPEQVRGSQVVVAQPPRVWSDLTSWRRFWRCGLDRLPGHLLTTTGLFPCNCWVSPDISWKSSIAARGVTVHCCRVDETPALNIF